LTKKFQKKFNPLLGEKAEGFCFLTIYFGREKFMAKFIEGRGKILAMASLEMGSNPAKGDWPPPKLEVSLNSVACKFCGGRIINDEIKGGLSCQNCGRRPLTFLY
jgi:DNA-directed RNA polymerase subunit RPC12/RpoP